jgi:hypothetical protein
MYIDQFNMIIKALFYLIRLKLMTVDVCIGPLRYIGVTSGKERGTCSFSFFKKKLLVI